jgi:hypothetical protein
MKLVIDFEKPEYLKPRTPLGIFLNLFTNPLRDIIGFTPYMPPFLYRRTGIKRLLRDKWVSYKELGRAIRFDDEQANRALMKHLPRLGVHGFLSSSIYNLFTLALVVAELYILALAQTALKTNPLAFAALYGVMVFVLPLIIGLLALKISVVLLDRHFADTLALVSGIYLLIFLQKESSLADPEARRDILERMHILRRNIVLLSLMSSGANDSWPAAHFKRLEHFVREREHWVIAPQAQTLDDLRKDFGGFVEILVSGQYGNFAWSSFEDLQNASETAERKPAEKIVRFLASILPFVLLVVLFIFPAQIKAIGFDNNLVALFLLTWLLLAIDSGLKLGMVERVGSLAKTLKDLR